MKIPTIKQFNGWPQKDKAWFIDYETAGKHKALSRSKGYFPVIYYFHLDVAIVYEISPNGVLVNAEAMTVNEANDRLKRFEKAFTAVNSASRYN